MKSDLLLCELHHLTIKLYAKLLDTSLVANMSRFRISLKMVVM